MNPEIKERWVAALRSGEYEQGHNQLKISDTYCCLGVLCELAVKDNVIEGYNESAGYPDQVVLEWAGLGSMQDDEHNPPYYPDSDYRVAAKLNDRRKSFAEIADWIEEKL